MERGRGGGVETQHGGVEGSDVGATRRSFSACNTTCSRNTFFNRHAIAVVVSCKQPNGLG